MSRHDHEPVLAIAVLLLIVWLALSSSQVAAEEAVRRGRLVVKQWCAACHTISGRETDPDRAPTFEQIANRPGRTRTYFRSFLDQDHFPMTTYRLFDTEKQDVVALLMSLKKP